MAAFCVCIQFCFHNAPYNRHAGRETAVPPAGWDGGGVLNVKAYSILCEMQRRMVCRAGNAVKPVSISICIVVEEGTSVETIYAIRDYLLLSENDCHEFPNESSARKPLDNTTGYHYNILWLAGTNPALRMRVSLC